MLARFSFILCASLLLGLKAQESAPASRNSADLMKFTQPGTEHEELARLSGTWDVSFKFGSIVYSGTAEAAMVVGGRFLQIKYAARAKEANTEGIFTVGFDRRHQHYTLIAMDSFGTYAVTSQGKREGVNGRIKMAGKDDDPMMKSMGLTKEFLHVLDLKSSDEFKVEVFFIDTRTPERKEIKALDYTFKRIKS